MKQIKKMEMTGKTNFKLVILFFILGVFINSCTVVKKRYSPGYSVYIQKKQHNKHSKKSKKFEYNTQAKKLKNQKVDTLSKSIISPTSTSVIIPDVNLTFKNQFEPKSIRQDIQEQLRFFKPTVSNYNGQGKNQMIKKYWHNTKIEIQKIKAFKQANSTKKVTYIDMYMWSKYLMFTAGIGAILFMWGFYWAYKNTNYNIAVWMTYIGLSIMLVSLVIVFVLRVITFFLNL